MKKIVLMLVAASVVAGTLMISCEKEEVNSSVEEQTFIQDNELFDITQRPVKKGAAATGSLSPYVAEEKFSSMPNPSWIHAWSYYDKRLHNNLSYDATGTSLTTGDYVAGYDYYLDAPGDNEPTTWNFYVKAYIDTIAPGPSLPRVYDGSITCIDSQDNISGPSSQFSFDLTNESWTNITLDLKEYVQEIIDDASETDFTDWSDVDKVIVTANIQTNSTEGGRAFLIKLG